MTTEGSSGLVEGGSVEEDAEEDGPLETTRPPATGSDAAAAEVEVDAEGAEAEAEARLALSLRA